MRISGRGTKTESDVHIHSPRLEREAIPKPMPPYPRPLNRP